MNKEIQPKYEEVTVTCACGNTFKTKSTCGKPNLSIDICNKCHPFFTGKKKIVDASGNVEKFNKKYGLNDSNKPNA